MRSLLVAAALVALTACNTTLELKNYSQACSQASDCVAVYVGALCQVCGGCANNAIAVSDKAKYDADAKAISQACPPRFGPQPACAAAACLQPVVDCVNAQCTLKAGVP